ncbi:rifin [Plasmodium reichenowi]|uniref:Rifin n=1 Tax=Plasmodium reichenowi TaxID=5854 RepID=A0A060RMJ8_PLARE|nr:rifin [Plasmodium reichenowi]
MKVHYFNILFFALPLNILEHNQRNHYITTHTHTNRSLCECEIYAPVNYDNDPQMKAVMKNFNEKTKQRFHEYDDRMKTNRQKCKDQCDKEIQKIILKDKFEKQMAEKLTTLETKINSDDIPTCVCEKSLADKAEKFCLNCCKNMGAVAPWWGLVCGSGYAGWTNYVTQMAIQKGIETGIEEAIDRLSNFFVLHKLISISEIQSLIKPTNYANETTYVTFIQQVQNTKCAGGLNSNSMFCSAASHQGTEKISQAASGIADYVKYSAELSETKALDAAAPITNSLTTAITASVIAIVVIVLIMVIIYKILRYRRKKKMKKKLQYIKLLEE